MRSDENSRKDLLEQRNYHATPSDESVGKGSDSPEHHKISMTSYYKSPLHKDEGKIRAMSPSDTSDTPNNDFSEHDQIATPDNGSIPVVPAVRILAMEDDYWSVANAYVSEAQSTSVGSSSAVQPPVWQVETDPLCHSKAFPGIFVFLLSLIVFFRMIMCALLIRHRKHGNLQLAQPAVLAVLLLAGSVSIGGCALLLVHTCDYDTEEDDYTTMALNNQAADIFCLLRDPIILTPLTLAGCILLGRVWRIVLLLTPILQVHDDDEDYGQAMCGCLCGGRLGQRLKRHIMTGLTYLADIHGILGHYCRHHFRDAMRTLMGAILCLRGRRDMDHSHHHHHHHNNTSHNCRQRRKMAASIRRKVPVQQLLWLIFVLMIPQLLLQLCNLVVPPMQEHLQVDQQQQTTYVSTTQTSSSAYPHEDAQLQSTMTATNGFTVTVQTEQWECRTNMGSPWPTYLGIFFTIIPYMATAILAWNSAADLPKIFDEANATTRSLKVLMLAVTIIVPPRITIAVTSSNNPDVTVYLTTMLVFALAMPPCWFVVYPKIWKALQEDSRDRVAIRRLLLRKKQPSMRDYSASHDGTTTGHNTTHNNHNNNSNSAKLALTIGKMYEEMGLHSQSLTLFDDALAVWQVDPMRDKKEQVGGFTKDEIDAFSVSDLECVVQLLISKGRVHGTFNVGDKSGPKAAAQAWLDALEIYELAPARSFVKDRSMLFPTFSGLFVFLKGGKIQDDDKSTFEQNLAKKFVRETKLQGDPVHYTRAVAMLCEVKARLGRYKVALESFEILKQIYDPEEHSAGISEAYGTDRSAQAYSQCALWHMQLGQEDKALEACNYVLNEIMFLMDPKNVLNMCEMLLPILRIYVPRGDEKRMRSLFKKYVIDNYEKHFVKHDKTSPCSPVFKPLMLLLDIRHDPSNFKDFEDIVEWLIEEENGVVPDFLDSVYTKLCWSPNTMTAELCLRVAEQLIARHGDVGDTEALILKGLELCQKADKKIKDKNNTVKLPIAHGMNDPVFSELKVLAVTQNIQWLSEEDGHNSTGLASSLGSKLDLKNLPHAYKKNLRSSEGGSSSNLSPLLARTSLVSFATGSKSADSSRGSRGSRGNDVNMTIPDTTNARNVLRSQLSEISLDSKFRSRIESGFDDIDEFAEEDEGESDRLTEKDRKANLASLVEGESKGGDSLSKGKTTPTVPPGATDDPFADDEESPIMF
ncbi:adenylate cyclase 10 (soluble) [Seminavis robusta]|uniref:Adenylate cyclase 10 (Soluble) n=1 Tax=Seminavis robusta TaxID=568900 RepID=A0A9N8DPA3_9STRA|nr:adenylate cyclase 10 (soluble) [Seminavis robusta]|eukprot:Sro165_g073970.1 adenylate cyclase 10 (soluble) (1202) ;mRNA; f:85925-89530